VLALIGAAGWFCYVELSKPEQVASAPEKTEEPVDIPDPTGGHQGEPEIVPADPIPNKPDPKPEQPKEPPKEVPKTLPELPAFDKPKAKEALIEATFARTKDGRWEDHAEQLKALSIETLNRRPRMLGIKQLDDLSEKEALPLALAQLDLLERMGVDRFARWVSGSPGFAGNLLTSRERLELFVNNLVPEDSPVDALRVWERLDEKAAKPEEKAKYQNLAIALALIHDRPRGENRATDVYDYYVAADAKKKLYVDFQKISPDELAWGVGDHKFQMEDMEWALSKLKHPASRLGDAYAQIPYRLNHPPYPAYTMENILSIGGVCQQQAEFSEANARARGIPGAYISGEGSRGGHAWFAFRTERGWVNNVGRYGDGYACGHARSPQTGKSFREWDLFLFDDPGRRNGDREASLRLIRAGRLMGEANDIDNQLNLLESAAQRNQANPTPWRAWFSALLQDKREKPVEYWQRVVNDCRIALKKNPDFFEIPDQIETEKIFPKQDPDKVGESLRTRRRQAIRENPNRFDLLVDSIRREVAYYQSRNDARRIGLLYNNALRTYGKNLPTFIMLAEDFAKASEDSPEIRRAALSVMESVFNKDVDSKLKGDGFRLPMEVRVCRKLVQVFEMEGNDKKVERYTKRADEIEKTAKAKRAAMQ
jgi:hypothetical protein